MSDKKTENDILDDVKKIEKIKKARMLSEALSELKDKAKQILILKKETEGLLKEIGLCETDRKKVIDYVNSNVKLTPSDLSNAKRKARTTKDSFEKDIEKKIKDSPMPFIGYSVTSTPTDQWVNGSNLITGANTTGTLGSICSSYTSNSGLNVTLGGQSLKL